MFVQLRVEFKKWNDHLNSTKPTCQYIYNVKHLLLLEILLELTVVGKSILFLKQVCSLKEFSQNYRGRELLGFSNYSGFELVLREHVAKLKKPAIELLIAIKGTVLSHT